MVSRSMASSQQAENLPGKFNSIVPPLVELGGMGRKDKEFEAILLAGLPEFSVEPNPSIHLNTSHRKEALFQEFFQEFPSQSCDGPGIGGDKGKTRNHIPKRDVLFDLPRERTNFQGINHHEISRFSGELVLGPSLGIGSFCSSPLVTRIPRAPSSLRTFLFFPRKGYTSLSFRTRFSKLWSPLGFADSFGSFGTILKTFQVSGTELLATVRRCSG
jgi:hypothetical protein